MTEVLFTTVDSILVVLDARYEDSNTKHACSARPLNLNGWSPKWMMTLYAQFIPTKLRKTCLKGVLSAQLKTVVITVKR
jgi:hypothetical protein